MAPAVLLVLGNSPADDARAPAAGPAAARLREFGISFLLATTCQPAPEPPSAGPAGSVLPLQASEAAALLELAPYAIYVLGGPVHGWRISGVSHPWQRLQDTIGWLIAERLADWASAVHAAPSPVYTRSHKPGSDSTGVVQFRTEREIVAKIGGRDVIEAEERFESAANRRLRREGFPPLFPLTYAVCCEGSQAVSLMEAGEPSRLADRVFADPARTIVAEDAVTELEPIFSLLSSWYRMTAENKQPTCAGYLYRERFHVLPGHPAFISTFDALLPGEPPAELLGAAALLPHRLEVAGLTEAVRWLDRTCGEWLPEAGSSVHGDIYPTNILRRADGTPMLIDPRTVWEGRPRPDEGYGDPIFDLATLLHGMLPMAAILAAAERGTADELFHSEARLHGDVLDMSGLALPAGRSGALVRLEERMLEIPPGREPEEKLRTRLYVGAAVSLLGWLKYQHSLKTRSAWLATYAYVIWYLRLAREVWDHRSATEEP